MDSESSPGLYKSKLDQPAFNFTKSQAATTYAGSMAETQDDARTNVSTYSFRSGIDTARLLREAHGRTINAVSDAYFLPTDDDEWARLDKQHTAIVLGLGGLYPTAANVPAILRPQEGQRKKILDLGCGTGVWTVAMAREFPDAEVLGVDLAPVPAEPENLPNNCRFEVDDINLGMDHFAGQYDLIHIRLVGSGLKDIHKSMLDIERCLKPGGLVLWLDIDYDLWGKTNGRSESTFIYKPVASELNPGGAWLYRPIYEMRRSAVLGGSDVHNMERAIDEGLWNHPTLDPETCKAASLYLPIGPWVSGGDPAQDTYSNYVGTLMRVDIKSGHRAIHPLLIRSGWSRETVNEWSDRADEEMSTMKDQMSLRIRIAWGRHRATENAPAPPLPDAEDDPDELERHRYPYLYVYNSREEALAQTALRARDKPVVAPFHPADGGKTAEA